MSGIFRWRRVCARLTLAALSVTPLAHAGTPHLVLDVNSVAEPISSEPRALGRLGGVELFRATLSTPEVPRAGLVKSDGTPAGTVIIKTFEGDGPREQPVMTIGTRAFFIAEETATGSQVWVTDGTAAGTRQVTNIPLPATNPATPSDPSTAIEPPRLLAAFGNDLLFVQRVGTDYQLYRTDGTTAGTVRLGLIRPDATSGVKFDLAVVGNRIYFVSLSGTVPELWASDGTEAGTKKVLLPGTLGSNPYVGMLRAVQGGVVFLTSGSSFGQEITRIDAGTDAISVVDLSVGPTSGVNAPTLPVVNGYVYFAGTQGQTGDYELWRSDGTPGGTTLVKDINAGAASSFQTYLTAMAKIGNRVVFTADDGTGSRLWGSDGTASGTTKLVDFYLDFQFVLEGDTLPLEKTEKYLYVTSRTGPTVATDGTPGGTMVLPSKFSTGENVSFAAAAGDATSEYVELMSQNPTTAAVNYHVFKLTPPTGLTPVRSSSDRFGGSSFEYVNGKLVFDAYDDTAGQELWVNDDAGSRRLADLTPQTYTSHSNPQYLTDWNGKLAFSAEDGVHGTELWISDGTAAGTKLLADINPGEASSSPQQLFVWNGALYFFASNGSYRLMRLSTPEGTPEVLATIDPPPRYETTGDLAAARCLRPRPAAMGNKLYFSAKTAATGAELWSTDGTAAGTAMVADINTNIVNGKPLGSLPCNFAVFKNRLYFAANSTASELSGALWSTDGTTAGTVPLTTQGITNSFVIFNDALYFGSSNLTTTQLWKSDGTTAGTTLLDGPGVPSGIVNGKLGLLNVTSNPPEIWVGDGTSTGTTRVSDSMGGFTISLNRIYYLRMVSGVRELWSSDGTVTGTQRIRTLAPPATGYAIFEFRGATHLMISDPAGRTVWRTDGTEAGTTQVGSTVPRPTMVTTSIEAGPVVSGQNVFYAGLDALTGNELYAIPAEDAPPPSGGNSGGGAGGAAGGVGGAGSGDGGGGGGGGPMRWYDLLALAALLSWRFVRNSRHATELGKNLSPAVNNL